MPIPRITDFAAHGADPDRYLDLSADWSIAVADVVASTALVAQGQDRAVNFVAGAVVAVLGEVVGTAAEPAVCQFAGDGAIVAVPPGREGAAREALAALAHWAQVEIGVPLRVGLVPVAALREAGHGVLAALHDFGGGNVLGLFLGSGVMAAEAWVKDAGVGGSGDWRIAPWEGPLPGLEGLSCRWQPVAARRGTVVCALIDPVPPGRAGIAALARVQAELAAVVSPDLAAPFGTGDHLVPPGIPAWSLAGLEARTRRGRLAAAASRLRGLLGSGLLHLAWRRGGTLGPIDARRYLRSVARQSDHRKLAGGLRLVMDLTLAEAEAVEAVLVRAEAAGLVAFGLARSDAATMTCLVGDFSSDRHVHFVDGAGLGFWRAATALKAKRIGANSP
ncbi:DUF3095 family protein [Novispirillum sp. DQ9]|uniref:DUF3095 family protein n=1 Tax=Novispirillum sp. DQ9 TaxID=3398612 RepID=UPI003C7D25A3